MNPLPLSTWSRAFVLTFAVTGFTAPHAYAQKQATAIKKLADLLGDAIKAAAGTEAPKLPAPFDKVLVPPPVRPGPPTAAAELKERNDRLEAYSDVSGDWFRRTLNLKDGQQQILSETYKKRLAASQDVAKRMYNVSNQKGHRYFTDYFPIKFTDKDGASRQFDFTSYRSVFDDVDLTREQEKKLEEVKQERKDFRDAAAIGYLMNILDSELYFAPRQRTAFAEGVRSETVTDVTGYAVRTSTYYFNQKPIGPILQRGAYLKLLSNVQRQRAAHLATSGGSSRSANHVSFSANEGAEAWHEKLRKSTKSQHDRLMQAIEVRVEFYQTLCDLPRQTTRHLRVAGKGASEEMIASWKTATRRNFEMYEQHTAQMGGRANFSFSVSPPTISQLAQNEIWTQAVSRKIPESDYLVAARDRVRTDANANFIVAMLDKELWLTQDQREQLLESLTKKLPSPDQIVSNPSSTSSYYTEIGLLALALHKLSEQEISVLTDKQLRVWNMMKKSLPTEGRYVLVRKRNGSSSRITIP